MQMTPTEKLQLSNFNQTCVIANLVSLKDHLTVCELTPEARTLVDQLDVDIEHLAGCLRELQQLKARDLQAA